MNKNTTYLILLVYAMLYYTTYFLPYTFFVELEAEKHLNSIHTGITLGVFAIGVLLGSFIVGMVLHLIGKANSLLVANIVMIITLVGFAFIKEIENKNVFFAIAIVIRVLEGIALGITEVVISSYVPQLFPNDIQRKGSAMELMGSFGNCLGIIMGTLFYELFGYMNVFFIEAIILTLSGSLLFFVLKKQEDRVKEQQLQEEEDQKSKLYHHVYVDLLKDRQFSINVFMTVLDFFCFIGIISIFKIYTHSIKIHNLNSSIILIIGILFYTFFMVLFSIVKIKIDRRIFYYIGFTLLTICSLIFRPQSFWGIKPNFYTLTISFLLGAVGSVFYLSVNYAEMIMVAKNVYQNKQRIDQQVLYNIVTSFIISSNAIGQLLGPILFGIGFFYIQMENLMWITIGLYVMTILIYTIFGQGYEIFTKKGRENPHIELAEEQ